MRPYPQWKSLSMSENVVSVRGSVLGVDVRFFSHERGWGLSTRPFFIGWDRDHDRYGPGHSTLVLRVFPSHKVMTIGNKGGLRAVLTARSRALADRRSGCR